jgi:lipid-binding SYLF domain-containing protein
MQFKTLLMSAVLVAVPVLGYAQSSGEAVQQAQDAKHKKTPVQRRATIDAMARKTLSAVYKKYPQAKSQIEQAAGYAVFHVSGVTAVFLGAGAGEGVAVTGKERTYMSMVQGKVGLGLGVKDAREVWVFTSAKAYDNFVNKGWTADASADATAKTETKGGQIAGAVRLADDVFVYQFTEKGLMAEATVAGSKYSRDDALNKK